jgi:hypothetical protein
LRGWRGGFGGWCRGVVDGRVLACGARWDGEEFVKGQEARFAACPSFLAFVEDWWTGMVDARLVRVSEDLAAALVHAFLSHWGILILERAMGKMRNRSMLRNGL